VPFEFKRVTTFGVVMLLADIAPEVSNSASVLTKAASPSLTRMGNPPKQLMAWRYASYQHRLAVQAADAATAKSTLPARFASPGRWGHCEELAERVLTDLGLYRFSLTFL
jgi:hypothetical protein